MTPHEKPSENKFWLNFDGVNWSLHYEGGHRPASEAEIYFWCSDLAAEKPVDDAEVRRSIDYIKGPAWERNLILPLKETTLGFHVETLIRAAQSSKVEEVTVVPATLFRENLLAHRRQMGYVTPEDFILYEYRNGLRIVEQSLDRKCDGDDLCICVKCTPPRTVDKEEAEADRRENPYDYGDKK
jgi:hypothetical protein